jgi:hypothetical protein
MLSRWTIPGRNIQAIVPKPPDFAISGKTINVTHPMQ